MILLQQMIALFVFMMIGYAMHKKKITDEKSEGMLSWFIVNIANPCLILSGAVTMEDGVSAGFLGYVFLLSLAMYAGLILLSYPVSMLLMVKKDDRGLFRLMTVFSNIGFMGVPLLSALYGSTALIYGAIFGITFNILLYTWGVMMICKGKKESGHFELKNLINPGTVASIITLIIALLKIDTPAFVDTIVVNLSNTTVSLSMIVIGASLAKLPIKVIFTNDRLIIFSILKLLVIPIAVLFIVKSFVYDEMLQCVFLIMVSTPVAALSTMLAKQHEGNESLAAGGVAVTTVFSVLTIPLVSLITGVG